MMHKADPLLADRRRKYMTVLEVAEYLNIGRSTVYELINSGEIHAKKFGKKSVRVHIEELERYERESDWTLEAD